MIAERRNRRSSNLKSALEFQLAASMRRGEFDSLVLADETGLVIAAAGKDTESDALAAVSPKLAGNGRFWHGNLTTGASTITLSVKPVISDSGTMYLCAKGGLGGLVSEELHLSGRGVCRILAV